jgi:hypothetical protein
VRATQLTAGSVSAVKSIWTAGRVSWLVADSEFSHQPLAAPCRYGSPSYPRTRTGGRSGVGDADPLPVRGHRDAQAGDVRSDGRDDGPGSDRSRAHSRRSRSWPGTPNARASAVMARPIRVMVRRPSAARAGPSPIGRRHDSSTLGGDDEQGQQKEGGGRQGAGSTKESGARWTGGRESRGVERGAERCLAQFTRGVDGQRATRGSDGGCLSRHGECPATGCQVNGEAK